MKDDKMYIYNKVILKTQNAVQKLLRHSCKNDDKNIRYNNE